jgi:ABC-2 type transport system permease protein
VTGAIGALYRWFDARAAFVSNRVRVVLAYRTDALLRLTGPMLQVILMGALWRALYAHQTTVNGVSLDVMTTYVCLAAMQQWVNRDDTIEWLSRRVRSGAIGMDLSQPVGLLTQQVCGQVAQLMVKAPMVVLILPVSMVAARLTLPAPGALGPYVVASLLGWLINSCLNLLVAVTCFWTTELAGMTFLYFVISGFLSGALVPLWFMPGWLAGVLGWLPLQAVTFTPLSIYVGRSAGTEAWQAIGVQTLWLALLAGAVWLTFRRAVHRTVVQGG